MTGDSQIRDDYVALGDIYHVLGACRISTLFAGVATLIHAGLYLHLVEHHPFRSLGALIGGLYIAALWLRVVQHNRDDTLHTMRRQVRRDLRMWLARNPRYLTMHPDVREEVNETLGDLANTEASDGSRGLDPRSGAAFPSDRRKQGDRRRPGGHYEGPEQRTGRQRRRGQAIGGE
jgi:hypothetical protein